MSQTSEIQSLCFNMEADTANAASSIDRLTKSLRELKTVTKSVKSISNVSAALQKISYTSMNKHINDFVTAISRLNKAEVSPSIASGIEGLARSIESLKKATASLSSLKKASEAINQMTSALNSENLKDFMSSMESIGGRATSSAAANTANLAKSLKSLGKGLNTSILRKVAESIKSLSENSTETAVGMITGLGRLKDVKLSATLPKGIRQVGEAVKVIDESDIEKVERLCDALYMLKGVDVRGIGTAARAVRSLSSTAVTPKSATTTEVTPSGGGTAPSLTEADGEGTSLGSRFATAALGRLSSIFTTMKHIMFYRLVRGLFASAMNAMIEGVNNVYNYSKQAGTAFASSMDKISTSANYLKNSIGAMLAPIINTVAPAVEWVADRIVDLFNFINRVIAALRGQETYTVAKKIATSYNNATNSVTNTAVKALKKLKNYTSSLDELNVISPDSSTSSDSSGGTSGTGTDYGSMFDEVNTNADELVSDMGEKLKEFFTVTVPEFAADMAKKVGSALGTVAGIVNDKLIKPLDEWITDIPVIGDVFTKLKETVQGVWSFLTEPDDEKRMQMFTTWFFGSEEEYASWQAKVESFKTGLLDIKQSVSDAWDFIRNLTTEDIELSFVEWFFGDIDSYNSWVTSVYNAINGIRSLLGKEPLEIPTIAKVTKTDKKALSESDKRINAKARFTEGIDALSNKERKITMKARLIETITSSLPSKYKTLSMKGSITEMSIKDKAINMILTKLTSAVFKKNAGGGIFRGGSWHPVQTAATGGTFSSAQMFIAREAGPELVGTIGSHTAVLNNDQIVASVASGVASAVAAVMRAYSSQQTTYTLSFQSQPEAAYGAQGEDFRKALDDWYDEKLRNNMESITRDTKTQAEKSSTVSVQMNGRELVKAIEKQKRANGYAFG